MRPIGLHVRMERGLEDVINKVEQYSLSSVQFFSCLRGQKGIITVPDDILAQFHAIAQKYLSQIYIHSSYTINLGNFRSQHVDYFAQECMYARKCGATHVIVHPGSYRDKKEGMRSLVQSLNHILSNLDEGITIVLENTAHKSRTLGSDITDFIEILLQVKESDRLAFCIDTAHAHGFGYDFSTIDLCEQFVHFLATTIGIDRIAMLHLNDAHHERGSCHDYHAMPGAGKIGNAALYALAFHPLLQTVPLLLELPNSSCAQEYQALRLVREWHGIV